MWGVGWQRGGLGEMGLSDEGERKKKCEGKSKKEEKPERERKIEKIKYFF